MSRKRAWQKGAADLVSVAVGLTIMAIVTAGTAASMVYGRETLAREEHYQVAAYALRGVMEEVQGELMYDARARRSENLGYRFYREVPLDRAADHGGVDVVTARLTRDVVDRVNLPETGPTDDYYVVTVRAAWTERDYAEDNRGGSGQKREIVLTTAIMPSALLN